MHCFCDGHSDTIANNAFLVSQPNVAPPAVTRSRPSSDLQLNPLLPLTWTKLKLVEHMEESRSTQREGIPQPECHAFEQKGRLVLLHLILNTVTSADFVEQLLKISSL